MFCRFALKRQVFGFKTHFLNVPYKTLIHFINGFSV